MLNSIFRIKLLAQKMNRKILSIIVSTLFIGATHGQNIIDLSHNVNINKINIKGTYLSIDTTGLQLESSGNPNVFMNKNDRTILAVEQKQVSIAEYESIIENLLKFDTVYKESKIVLNEYTGKMINGEISMNDEIKECWLCYVGKQDFVVEIKGIYSSSLKNKYRSSFETAIKSIYIEHNRKITMYENLPFFLDERKFPYKKVTNYMPQSIALSREVDGYNRVVTISYFEANKDKIEELKQDFTTEVEKIIIGKKEVITQQSKTDSKIRLEGLIIGEGQVISLNCISSAKDEKALSEFKKLAESITFK